MARLPFIKMHGARNDYVYIDGVHSPVPDDLPNLARRVSCRHTGVGSDGLVVILPPQQTGTDAAMRMFNADGSEGSLCGNALRCVALWLAANGRRPVSGEGYAIQMGARVVPAEVQAVSSDGCQGSVRILIGSPSPLRPDAAGRDKFAGPVALYGVGLPELLAAPQHVSPGNPHLVLFTKSLASCDVHGLGAVLERHPLFPDRTNVEFVEPLSRSSARVRVWERGSGETQACGSGACAVVVAGTVTGLFDSDCRIRLEMPGGALGVTWNADNQLWLDGPAAITFEGSLVT
jgi:diaminopimelate epimerase